MAGQDPEHAFIGLLGVDTNRSHMSLKEIQARRKRLGLELLSTKTRSTVLRCSRAKAGLEWESNVALMSQLLMAASFLISA